MLAKIFKSAAVFEDNLIAIAASWTVGPLIGTVAGFYIGTVVGSDHVVDLQVPDIKNGFIGAGIGLALSLIFAVWVTVVYPKATKRDGDYSDDAH